MRKLKLLLAPAALAACLTGCVNIESLYGPMDPQISAVELQALQTREYEATEAELFSAVIGAFQSYGYLIQSADRTTGLVIAKTNSQTDIDTFNGITKIHYDKATAFIEKIAKNRVSLRISIVDYVAVKFELVSDGEREAMRTRPEIYQRIFEKIDHSLFLKKNL